MNGPHPEQRDPDTGCPDWCEMHIDGRHVGALSLDGTAKGSNVYTRLVGYADGRVGVEVVVAQVDSTKKPALVELTPDEIAQHARVTQVMESDLWDSLAAYEDGTPVDYNGNSPNQ